MAGHGILLKVLIELFQMVTGVDRVHGLKISKKVHKICMLKCVEYCHIYFVDNVENFSGWGYKRSYIMEKVR